MLNCEGLLEFNVHATVVIHSCVVILHCVGISSCVGSAGARYILKHRKTHAWSENASLNSKQRREGRATSFKTLGTGQGVMYANQVVKIEF